MEQFRDNDFGSCKILFRRAGKIEHVCLFASHTFSSFLPEYVYYYLEAIKNAGLSLIFISSSPVSDDDVKKLSSLACIVIEKENKGTDFGAWCATLRWLNYGKEFQTLYLCNDSVFGPFIPFGEIHKEFYAVENDILGITDSHQGAGYHIQSYFVGLKSNVLGSEIWKNFWAEMRFHKDKQKVIEYYEIGLTQRLLETGFTCFIWTNWAKKFGFSDILKKVSKSEELRPRWLNRVLYEQMDIILDINPSSFLWKELIVQCNNPFIKRELFIFSNLYSECELDNQWEAVLEKYGNYPVWLIKLFLVNHFFFKSIKNGMPEVEGFNVSLLKDTDKPDRVNREKKTDILLFKALESLLKPSEIVMDPSFDASLSQLDRMGILYLPIVISSNRPAKAFTCTLLYFNYDIAGLDAFSLVRIKMALKRIINPVIIVPDTGSKAIVASLLSLRHDGLVLEKEFLFPTDNCRVTEYFRSLFNTTEKKRLSLFQRPTLADVARDAINMENRSAFVVEIDKGVSQVLGEGYFDAKYYDSRSDYLQYLSIKEKYNLLYENTPLWYKKLGQVIKIFTRNKQLTVQWKDKGLKEHYRPTTQDLLHWYHIQYEVLPGWFKDIGKSLVKKKTKA